jgi:predicted alpha-1,2-mannosidase
MKKLIISVLALICTVGAIAATVDYTSYVDTRIGTRSEFKFSHGNTYPAAGRPFGVHLWSPQTGEKYDGWKYDYAADKINGFEQSHQCSPWVQDYGVFILMPETGKLVTALQDRGASFKHANETARPHWYKVTFDNGITTEMAPTERANFMRISYPKTGKAYLVIDGYNAMSEIKVDPAKKEVTGWVNNIRHINARGTFKCHFVIRFDTPFEEFGVWENRGDTLSVGVAEKSGRGAGAYLAFKKGAKLNIRIASSYISEEQARITLDRELGPFKTLEQVKADGAADWNALLSRVDVSGATLEETRTFYSCLWRSNLFSRKFYEIDAAGKPHYWSAYDGLVHEGKMFTDNGFWDTFRSQFPLTNILHPTMQGEYMQAIMDAYDQLGWLLQWSSPGETGGMIGNHAISLLADAWAKGIRSFDPEKALKAYFHEVTNRRRLGRVGWEGYWTLGYVPFDGKANGSTARTLEYAYDDYCAFELARMTGNDFYKNIFGRAMYNYRNVFDPETGFMRGRMEDGSWAEPFDPEVWGGPYVEGDAWHYIWSVFQDIQGLINLFGSDEAFTAKLDAVFTTPGSLKPGTYGFVIHELAEMAWAEMGQYAHGNQPIQHMPYLYNYAGQPWKTQYWVRQIMKRLYNSGPTGYPGDEDQGGMSSWYTLSALGIYSVTPGTDQYVIGSPVFQKAVVTLEDGKKFTILADNNSTENVYIQSATLNGKPLEKNWISYYDIMAGGELHLVMGPTPAKSRCIGKDAAPFSLSAPSGN